MELGPYDLLEQIGSGAMGRVFAARDRRSGQLVAIKALLPASSSDHLFSIKREFRIAMSLSSPHLVPIYDLFVEGSAAYISMPLLRGRTLDEWARDTDWRRDPARLGEVLVGALQGLVDLHGAGLVHRDVKPKNIMVEPDGSIILVDYGLATRTAPSGFITSSPDAIAGTLGYVGPETVYAADPSPAQDLFAFGAMLYELMTGALPERSRLSWRIAEPEARDAALAGWPEAPAPVVELLAQTLRNDAAARGTAAQALATAARLCHPRPVARRARGSLGGRAPGDAALIGRDRELARLGDALAASGARIAVLGPSGIGKTSLVARALGDRRAQVPGGLVLAGRCHPGEHVRYRVFDELVDELTRWLMHCGRAERARLVRDEHGVLRQTFPVLDRVIAEPAAGAEAGDPQERRRRLGDALTRLLAGVHASWPLTLWIDDVHWADEDGLQLLLELARAFAPGGPSLVLSGRALPATIAGLCGVELTVPPLSEPDADELVARRASGRARAAGPAAPAVRAVAGNPGMICFLVDFHTGDPGRAGAPLAEIVGEQLRALGPGAVELATAMSLLGEPLPMCAVHRVCRAASARDDIHRLEHVGLVRRVPFRGLEALEIVHDALRDAIRDGAAGQDCSEIHRALATELGGVTEVPREVIASHWSLAGDADQAAELWLAAGRQAIDALAFDHAVRCFENSWQCGGRALLPAALREQARALSYAGQLGRAATYYVKAAEAAGDDDRFALHQQAAVHFLLAGDIDAGMALVHALFAGLGVRLPRWRAAVIAGLVRHRWTARRRHAALYQVRSEAVEPHATLADLAYRTALGLSPADVALSNYVQGLHYTHSLRSGSPDRIARALSFEAMSHITIGGDEAEARALLANARSLLGAEVPAPLGAVFATVEASLAWTTGRWGACVERAAQAERIAREQLAGAWWEINFSRAVRQDALRWAGRYGELAELTEDSLADARRRGDRFGQVTFRTRFAATLHLLGDRPDVAWRECDASADWKVRAVHLQHLAELHSRAECLLYRGEVAAALRLVEDRISTLRWAPLLRAAAPRMKVFHQLAVCRLARAAQSTGRPRRRLLRAARAAIGTVRRMPWDYAALLADLVIATADHLDGRDAGPALDALADRARVIDMPQYAEAIALFRARDAGDREACAAALRARGAADPARWSAVLLPGLFVAAAAAPVSAPHPPRDPESPIPTPRPDPAPA